MIKAGLIGASISGSLTPPMHEAEGRAQGLDYVYQRIDTETPEFSGRPLPDLLRWAVDAGLTGLNITYPFKQAVMPLLDHPSDAALALGAVNTVLIKDGALFGENTDFTAYSRDIATTLSTRPPQRVLLAGAGGAGTAVALALAKHGVAHLGMLDSNLDAARALIERLERHAPAQTTSLATDASAQSWDALVNCTPMGMSSHPGMAADPASIAGLRWVQDIVYFPLKTELLKRAEALGLETFTGARLAIGQAADSFRLFTGFEPDEFRMRATFLTHIKEQSFDA